MNTIERYGNLLFQFRCKFKLKTNQFSLRFNREHQIIPLMKYELQIEILDIAVVNIPIAAFHLGHAVFFINRTIDYRPLMSIAYGCLCSTVALSIFDWNQPHWNIYKTVTSAIFVLVYCCWYAVEMQVVTRKKHRFRFHPDDAFFLILCFDYVDVWNVVLKCSFTSDSRPHQTKVDVAQPPNIYVNTFVQVNAWGTRGIRAQEDLSVCHWQSTVVNQDYSENFKTKSVFLISIAIFPLPRLLVWHHHYHSQVCSIKYTGLTIQFSMSIFQCNLKSILNLAQCMHGTMMEG